MAEEVEEPTITDTVQLQEVPMDTSVLTSETLQQSPDTTTVPDPSLAAPIVTKPIDAPETPKVLAKETPPKRVLSHQPTSVDKDTAKRKFRILGLTYPAALDVIPLRTLMAQAQNFHFWFERPSFKKKDIQKGGLSLLFDTESEAKTAFESVQNLTIVGSTVKLHADKSFYEPEEQIEELSTDPELHQKLFIWHLLPSVDENLLGIVFEAESVKSVQVSLDETKKDGSKVAIVTFNSKEQADQARKELDGFTMDDGEVSRPMRIITYLEHLRRKRHSHISYDKYDIPKKRSPIESNIRPIEPEPESRLNLERGDVSGPSKSTAGNMWSQQIREAKSAKSPNAIRDAAKSPNVMTDTTEIDDGKTTKLVKSETKAPADMTEEELGKCVHDVISEQRINWAELTTADDLWSLLDKTCEQIGWLPDSTLRDVMFFVLKDALAETQADWMNRHLNVLLKCWKKEMTKGDRPRKRDFQLEAPMYEPPAEKPKPKPRNKEHKKQIIGLMGVGALLANAREKFQPEDGEVKEEEAAADVEPSSPPPTKSKIKKRIAEEKTKKRKRLPSSSPESPKELEEGEMASSSDGQSDDSSSSDDTSSSDSSSDTSSDDGKGNKKEWKSRERRRKRRERERKKRKRKSGGKKLADQMQTMMPQMMGMFGQLYQTRMQMFQRMSTEQKQQMQNMFKQFQQGQFPSPAQFPTQQVQPQPPQPQGWSQQQQPYNPAQAAYYGQQPQNTYASQPNYYNAPR